MKPLKLVYGMMGCNRLHELRDFGTMDSIVDAVDQIVYIDGSSGTDGTIEWLSGNYPRAPFLFVDSVWSDDFPGQRNKYLRAAESSYNLNDFDTWMVVSDTDEVYSLELGKELRNIIEGARQKRIDMLQIRCKSVTVEPDGTRSYENLDDFHKPLVFRLYTGTEYWADRSEVTGGKTALHEALRVGGRFAWTPKTLNDAGGKYIYEHIKSQGTVWERGFRNFIVFGGGPNLGEKQPLWKPFREMMSDILGKEDFLYNDALDYMKAGNIDQRLRDWLIQHKDEDGYDGSSEVREGYLTYFKYYHPEELPTG